jgi:hypothetical protein
MQFVIESRTLVTKTKSITPTFVRQVSEVGFGELTDLPGFRFDEF